MNLRGSLARFWVASHWFAGLSRHQVSADWPIRRSRHVRPGGAYCARRLTRVQEPKRIFEHLKAAGVVMLSDVSARCRYPYASQECASIGCALPKTPASSSQFGDDSQLTLYDWRSQSGAPMECRGVLAYRDHRLD